MQRELEALEGTLPVQAISQALASLTSSPRSSTLEPPVVINIAHISTLAFRMQARHKDNISFSTSLYELDRLIKEREVIDDEATLKEIRSKVPLASQDYADVFSKAASD
jgi:hypothetical protein